jgi:hypothetical protein
MNAPGQGHAVDSGNYVWRWVAIAALLIIAGVVSLIYS